MARRTDANEVQWTGLYNHPSQDDAKDYPLPDQARERQMTIYKTRAGRPRWVLHMQAVFWRFLMGLGMAFHRMAPPRPPKPNFSRTIPSTLAGMPGNMTLHFYLPKDYDTQKQLWAEQQAQQADSASSHGSGGSLKDKAKGKLAEPMSRISTMSSNASQFIRRNSRKTHTWGGYPVVINFHGGGFTLGSAKDDGRWCTTVVAECHAVVVSVDYRLAPECPFPTAVEDGVDALIYIWKQAEELGIDRDKIALSGFSSGGNMVFTVPLRLYDERTGFSRDELPARAVSPSQRAERAFHGVASTIPEDEPETSSPTSSTTRVPPTTSSKVHLLDPNEQPQPPSTSDSQSTFSPPTKRSTTETISEENSIPDIKIRCLIPWYPPVDYTRTREQRRETCRRKDQELPALFTDLFDESYLHPPHTIALDSPYLSPGVAPTNLLRNALPDEIIMHTCEWDMLLDEGHEFKLRLESAELQKNVWYDMVEGVPHGWDKAPNPWKPTPGVREHYLRACKEMRRCFGPEKGNTRPTPERMTTMGFPTVAARDSINVVR